MTEVRDRPAWAEPLDDSEHHRRFVQCGGCGCSLPWGEFVDRHLRECEGQSSSEEAA